MKKLVLIVMMFVLTCSFMVGVFTTDAQAGKPNHLVDKCKLMWPKMPAACNMTTCYLYYPYDCPWGLVLVWTGDYCCEP